MSSPRVYFTLTYLSTSGYVMITGGTADFSSALLSVDIYNPVTGCYNTSNMTYSRLKHTATYYNSSDVVLIIGGITNGGVVAQQSESISMNGTQLNAEMLAPRYSHEIIAVNYSDILVVAGQGFNDSSKQLEIYSRNSTAFQQHPPPPSSILDFEGFSLTNLGESGTALFFGGFNGTTYFRTALLINATNMTLAGVAGNSVGSISVRANHQATYIANMNLVLITGGDNGVDTTSTCYLYDVNSDTFNVTGSMNQRRSFHTAVALSNGSVLVIGGVISISSGQPSNAINLVERYDPITQSFTDVAPLNVARYRHKAVVTLSTGDVCVFGGIDDNNRILSSIECINPGP